MTISDYQMDSVIKTYMKTIKVKVVKSRENTDSLVEEDDVHISTEAIKKMMYNRIGEQISDKIKRLNPLRKMEE